MTIYTNIEIDINIYMYIFMLIGINMGAKTHLPDLRPKKRFAGTTSFNGIRHWSWFILNVEVTPVYTLKGLKAALARQERRLAQLMEISGGLDPEHPLQAYSLRRIAWLKEQIQNKQQWAAQK